MGVDSTEKEGWVDSRMKRMREAYDLNREMLGKAAKTRKTRYDTRVHPKTFEAGDWVLSQSA